MKKLSAVVAIVMLIAGSGSAAGPSVLFIGNSFLFGSGSAVRFYRADTVTDLNHEGIGGVPALFKSFAQQSGLDFDVALETRGGSGLDFHLANKLTEIGSRPWDNVVMHGFSLLDAEKPRDPAKLIATSTQMAELLRGKNPKVNIFLISTWPRADNVYPEKGAWHGQSVEVMGKDVRAAYDQAAKGAGIKTVIPVGESWLRAMPKPRHVESLPAIRRSRVRTWGVSETCTGMGNVSGPESTFSRRDEGWNSVRLNRIHSGCDQRSNPLLASRRLGRVHMRSAHLRAPSQNSRISSATVAPRQVRRSRLQALARNLPLPNQFALRRLRLHRPEEGQQCGRERPSY